MPEALIDDASTYPASVLVPLGNETRNAASVRAPLQTLTNRAAWLRAQLLDPTYTSTHKATWDTGSTALFKGTSQSTYQSGALSNYLDGSITTFELNSYLHLDGTNYVTGTVNVNTGGIVSFFDGSKLWAGTDTPVAGTDAEVIFRRYSTFLMAGVVTVASTAAVTYDAGSNQYWNGNAALAGNIQCVSAGRVTKHCITGDNYTRSYSLANGQIIMVPVLITNIVYTIQSAGASEGDEATVSMGLLTSSSSYKVTLKRDDASTILYPLSNGFAGTVPWMDLVFTGGAWQALRWGEYQP